MQPIKTRIEGLGNDQELPENEAQNMLALARFPSGWSIPVTRPLVWHGPVFADPAERQRLFTNGGVTHTVKAALANAMGLSPVHRAMFPGGSMMFETALRAAQELDDIDGRKADLLRFGRGDANGMHYVSANRAAWQWLGYVLYKLCVAANGGVGLSLIGADMEDQQELSPGAGGVYESGVYEGFAQAIDELGHDCQFFTYGTVCLGGVSSYTFNRQDGDPLFRRPGSMWQFTNGRDGIDLSGDNTRIFRERGAYVGRDGYQRRSIGKQPIYEADENGNVLLDSAGNPRWLVGNYLTSCYGQTFPTYRHERRYWVQWHYEELDDLVANLWWLYGGESDYRGDFVNMPTPRGTFDKRPELAKIQFSRWSRNNTEVESQYDPETNQMEPIYRTPEKGLEAGNQRPLTDTAVEYQFLLRTIGYQLNVIFSNEGNYLDWEQGVQGPRRFDYRPTGGQAEVGEMAAFGQFETMIKARLRGTNYPDFAALWDAGLIEFIIPKRPVVAGNTAFGEREIDKPCLMLFKERGGRRLWVFWCYPSQHLIAAHDRVAWFWVDGSGVKTDSYQLLFTFRKTGWAQMALPAGCEHVKAADFKFAFTSLLNHTFYFTGDFNVPVEGTLQIPPAATGPLVTRLTQA